MKKSRLLPRIDGAVSVISIVSFALSNLAGSKVKTLTDRHAYIVIRLPAYKAESKADQSEFFLAR